jgi:glycosyltransferase involved in cell wall biosynthesis
MPPEASKRILIVTEAWKPQVNGVVRTLETTIDHLRRMGHVVKVISPDTQSWRTVAWPGYAEVKLELGARKRLRQEVGRFNPDLFHIATEGPLGWAARNLCMYDKIPFTTSYHTSFPEYLEARTPFGLGGVVRNVAYATVRRFHAPSSAMLVATPTVEEGLRAHKFRNNIVRWSRGVDIELFKPISDKNIKAYENLRRPVMLYVGRVAVEKNLGAFLGADVPGSKVVVGDGPAARSLRQAYPSAHFLGAKKGKDLAQLYAAADLFVFPSKTDTFGLVLLEAAASGLPIAAYPVAGPIDILSDPAARSFAVLDPNLEKAMRGALALRADPEMPREFVRKRYSWDASAREFFNHLQAPTPEAKKRMRLFSIFTKRMGWLRRTAVDWL